MGIQVPHEVQVVGAALLDGQGRVLVARRGTDRAEAGKWEFPGGKVEPGEKPRSALAREVEEELGVQIQVGRHLGRGAARSFERIIILDVYMARIMAGQPTPREHSELRWCGPEDLAGLDWCAADIPVLAELRRELSRFDPSSID